MHNLTYKPGIIEYYDTPEPTIDRSMCFRPAKGCSSLANILVEKWLSSKKTVEIAEYQKHMFDHIVKIEYYKTGKTDFNIDKESGINIDSLADRIEIVDGECRLRQVPTEQNEAVEFAEWLLKNGWHERGIVWNLSDDENTTQQLYNKFKNRK